MEMGVLEKVAKVFERALELLELLDEEEVEVELDEGGGTIEGKRVKVTWSKFETVNDYVFSVSVYVKGQVAVARRVVHYYYGAPFNDRLELWYKDGKEEKEEEVYLIYEGEDLLDDDDELHDMICKLDGLMWKLTM